MYFLSTAFLTYHLELIELMQKDEEDCPELQRLERAIKDVVTESGISEMHDRQRIKLMGDHENLKKLIDGFMRM